MEARKLDVVLHSASGLKSANRMAVYVAAWIEPSVRVLSLGSSKARGSNPVFDTTVSVAIDEQTLGRGTHLIVELLGHGLVSTRRIGFVRVLLSDILPDGFNSTAARTEFKSLPVTRRSGRQQGVLSFDLHLHDGTSDALAAGEMTKPKPPPVVGSLSVSSPEKARGASMREGLEIDGEQSDDMVSPSTSSEDGHDNRISTRKRLYGLRPKSFSFNGLLSCY